MRIKEERIALSTPYGKLLIPVADIHRIDFATRTPPEVARRIDTAVADLASPQYSRREAATTELRKLRERAYSALLAAAEQKDPEVASRARTLLEELQSRVARDLLKIRGRDVIYTPESRLAGTIEAVTFRAESAQLGDVALKLTDLRDLRSPTASAEGRDDLQKEVTGPVQVFWGNFWWPAEIKEKNNGLYRIHYTGWDASWDEWVTRDRILFGNGKAPPGGG